MSGHATQSGWIGHINRYGWVIVAAAGALAYSNCFEGKLYLDDFRVIGRYVVEPDESIDLVPHPFTQRWLGDWSFTIGVVAFGCTLPAIHALNLAIHLAAGIALWVVAARTLGLPRLQAQFVGREGILATAVAGLWVVHPLNTQAVTYLCQRYESQMGLMVLVALWCGIRGATVLSGRVWWSALCVLSAYAATATKEPAVVFPFVFAVYDRLFLAASWREVINKRWLLYVGLLAAQAFFLQNAIVSLVRPQPVPEPTAAVAVEPLVLAGDDGIDGVDGIGRNKPEFVSAGFSAAGITPWMYLRTQAGVILHYLRLAIVPNPLVQDYAWPVATEWWQIWPQGAIILILLGATGWGALRGAPGSFLGVWFFAFLALSSSIIPIVDLANEHRMYLPLAAVLTAVVLGADRGLVRVPARNAWVRWVGVGAVVAVGTTFAALTHVRNEDYRDMVRMYRKMLAVVPDNGRVWTNLGIVYMWQGRMLEGAEAFREATQHPNPLAPFVKPTAQRNLIRALERGRRQELVPLLTQLVAEDPENPSRRFLLAHALFEARDLSGSVAEYRAAVAVAARNGFPLREPLVFAYYGNALMASGDPEAAIPELRHALELQGDLKLARVQLGHALARLGRYTEAEAEFRLLDKQNPRAPEGPYNLGIIQMYRGQPGEAAPLFREAFQRDRRSYTAALALGHALHESGRPAESRQVFALASQMLPDWPHRMVELSWRMSTHWEPRARYAAEGLRLAREVVAGVGDRDPGALDALAAALAENGQFGEAEKNARTAVEIARSGGHTELANGIEGRRALYARRQPYREPEPAPR